VFYIYLIIVENNIIFVPYEIISPRRWHSHYYRRRCSNWNFSFHFLYSGFCGVEGR